MAASDALSPQQFGEKKPPPRPRAKREINIHYSPDWDKPEQARKEISRTGNELF